MSDHLGEMAELDDDGTRWDELPDHIIIKIMSYLDFKSKYRAALVCKSWYDCFHLPDLWTRFTFNLFVCDEDIDRSPHMKCVELHGRHFRSIVMNIEQSHEENRQTACKLLDALAQVKNRKLSSIRFVFKGDNPLFYAGAEFVEALRTLFRRNEEILDQPMAHLTHVDLSGLSVAYDDTVFYLLSQNHSKLEYLNILNRILVCKVSPDCILTLIQRCRKLKNLQVFHCSLSDEALLALAEDNRQPLEHLGIACRREEKYGRDLTSEAWQQLVSKLPDLEVSLFFDHTCPLMRVSEIMKPEIPVHVLKLETFTMIYEEVNQASAYYQNTLDCLVLQTRYSSELGNALINLARTCRRLSRLIVYCVLRKDIVDEILSLLPEMKTKGTYILKWEQSPEPWVVGVEEGD